MFLVLTQGFMWMWVCICMYAAKFIDCLPMEIGGLNGSCSSWSSVWLGIGHASSLICLGFYFLSSSTPKLRLRAHLHPPFILSCNLLRRSNWKNCLLWDVMVKYPCFLQLHCCYCCWQPLWYCQNSLGVSQWASWLQDKMVDVDPVGVRPAEFRDQQCNHSNGLASTTSHCATSRSRRGRQELLSQASLLLSVVPLSCRPACVFLVIRVIWHHMVGSFSSHVLALYCISTCGVDVGKSYIWQNVVQLQFFWVCSPWWWQEVS